METGTSRFVEQVFYACVLALAGVYAVFAWESRADADISLSFFATVCVAAFVLSLLAARSIYRSAGRITFKHLFYGCVLIRAIAVFGEPVYEDDYYRYLWDGRQTIETGSPYSEPPAAAFDIDLDESWSEVLDNINYPELKTIYGPVNQYVFALAYLVSPADVFALQVIMACVDLLIITMLARIASLWAVALYAFSPLIIKEFTMTAHPDLLSVVALLAATLAWQRERLYIAAMALGAAVAAKLFALLLVPLLLRWSWKGWLIFVATLVALYLPILDRTGSLEALSAMAQQGLFNAPVYFLLEPYVDIRVIKISLSIAFIAFYAWYFFSADYSATSNKSIPRADWIFFAMLIALPIFNAWYLVFVLVFATIYPSAWAWTASLTVLFAYATGLQLRGSGLQLYEQPAWALMAEFIPVLLAAVVPVLAQRASAPARP